MSPAAKQRHIQAAGRSASLPDPGLIAVTDTVRSSRAAATARHISLGISL